MIEPAVNVIKSAASSTATLGRYNPHSAGNLSKLIIERPRTNKSQTSSTGGNEDTLALVKSEKASQYSIRTTGGSKEKSSRKGYYEDDGANSKAVMTLDEYR
jgi:hypothetical protein